MDTHLPPLSFYYQVLLRVFRYTLRVNVLRKQQEICYQLLKILKWLMLSLGKSSRPIGLLALSYPLHCPHFGYPLWALYQRKFQVNLG